MASWSPRASAIQVSGVSRTTAVAVFEESVGAELFVRHGRGVLAKLHVRAAERVVGRQQIRVRFDCSLQRRDGLLGLLQGKQAVAADPIQLRVARTLPQQLAAQRDRGLKVAA